MMYRELGPLDELTKIDHRSGHYMNEYPNNNVIEIDDFAMSELEDTFMPYFLRNSYKVVIRNLEEHIQDNPSPSKTPDFAKEDYKYNNKVREALEVLGSWYGVDYEI